MFSHLKQKTLVACPMAQARDRVKQFMKEGTGGVPRSHIPLGFCIMKPGSGVEMRVDHAVDLDIAMTSRPADLEARFDVEWKAKDGGPYPAFHGELVIENEDYSSFWLLLDGMYEPPFGLAGSAFDALVGRRIAAASARELLARIASFIEAGFQADEAQKRESILRSQAPSTAPA